MLAGPVNTYSGPGLLNTNWGPGPGAGADGQGQRLGNTNTRNKMLFFAAREYSHENYIITNI